MSKLTRNLLIFSGLVIALWVIGRLTNALQFYNAPTISNYPTIKNGDRFFASNLKKPKRLDFICYYRVTPEEGKQIYTHRLCGIEGDKVEIKNGRLFINDKSVDDNLDLAHPYVFANSEMDKLVDVEPIDEEFGDLVYQGDSSTLFLSSGTIREKGIKARRQVLPADQADPYIAAIYKEEWNQDHFGPLVVPKGKYFVLGDHRLASRDSRYLGFVDKSDYIATILGR